VSDELLRVAVVLPLAEREQAIATLLELAPDGFEEVDRDECLELVVFTDAAGADDIRRAFGSAEVDPVRPGWEDAWRAFHTAVRVGGVWIGPPWEPPPAGEPSVVIDPGRAFGTGAHPTTRLCVELLADTSRGALLDVGSGSGVLAIAAVLLGFAPVVAIDDDPVAVEVTRANALSNGVVLDAYRCDALSDPLPQTEVAVANVLLAPVEAILARIGASVVVTSGYLAGEVPAHTGWRRSRTVTAEGWAADRFERA
jgi:ribosomal protein L11 methyltransferase